MLFRDKVILLLRRIHGHTVISSTSAHAPVQSLGIQRTTEYAYHVDVYLGLGKYIESWLSSSCQATYATMWIESMVFKMQEKC